MEKLVLIGTSSLAPQTSDFIERYQLFDVIGFTVNKAYIKEPVFLGKPVFPIEELDKHIDKDKVKLFSTVTWYNYLNRERKKIFDQLKGEGYKFANLISPHALVYTEDLGEGNWIHDFAHIGYGVHIGDDNVIRMKCMIGHDSVIGNHNFFAVNSIVGGHDYFNDCCFIGLNALIHNRVAVGNKCVIGGGAIVKKDLPDFSLVVADNSFVKQCDEEKIESYISPHHFQRTVEDFNKLKMDKKSK